MSDVIIGQGSSSCTHEDDTISRQKAITALLDLTSYKTKRELVRRIDSSIADQNGWLGGVGECLDTIEDLPSAQPERKRGRWLITDAYPHNVYCYQCYKTFAQTHWAVWEDGTLPRKFCPNCGADMREVDADAID